ncbi:ywlC [Ecytonucleospora hepatopenaei]|uniref:Threonylcarbamoyl-AMP synthase n=1 Tax=Ecytonucleospora hepatopenaei TaxID=646526 RepID=A0A1W0E5L5_9MICR|nr:ywlC [Ecytonucleospora hepatopenaei]
MKILKLSDFEENKFTKEEILNFFNSTVVIPTETVYGLAGRIDNDNILKEIYMIKNRPSNNPLIVHVSNRKMLGQIVKGDICKEYHILMDKFWPGPLTLIYNAKEEVSNIVKGNSLNTVAVRMPQTKGVLNIIDTLGVPLAAPSANTSGRPSPTECKHAINDFKERVKTYIDGGKCSFGLESTVFMRSNGKNYILRPGSITKEEIENVLGEKVEVKPKCDDTKIICPGSKYTHYSPKIPLYLFKGANWYDLMKEEMKKLNDKKVGILLEEKKFKKAVNSFNDSHIIVYCLGGDLKECAAKLFYSLLALENEVDIIFTCDFKRSGEGEALMDRIEKASLKTFE